LLRQALFIASKGTLWDAFWQGLDMCGIRKKLHRFKNIAVDLECAGYLNS